MNAEFELYKFILSRGNSIEYNLIKNQFGDTILFLIQDLRNKGYINHERRSGVPNGVIVITRSGIKRYRLRNYHLLVIFFRPLLSLIRSKIFIIMKAIQTEIKKNTVSLLILIIGTIIAYAIMKYWLKWI
jgi:hypothetical protein